MPAATPTPPAAAPRAPLRAAAIDLQTQQALAGKIETLLLAQTPLIIPYWIDGLTATTKAVYGVNPTAIAQVFLGQTFKA